ncbi:hypothetical protein PG991_001557 [Apiospora marii]|uniref:Uncharacterized protein n=1 Tax=Apiospora marii TaxID=335849 RepID=A0ABR1SQ17_9PEZI
MRGRDAEPWFAPHCRYCGFDFETGQSFMALTDQGRVTRPYTHPSKRFEDDFRPPWMERDGHIQEVPYRARTGVLFGCHVACFEFATAKFVDAAKAHDHDHGQSLRLFRATERAFHPSAAYSRRRFAWLRERLACCIRVRYPVLPMELCLMVAGELVPEYAIASLAALSVPRSRLDGRDDGNDGWRLLDRGDDVWARYVHLDGVRYVASLSNSYGRGHTTRLYPAGKDLEDGSRVKDRARPAGVNIVENHLGIMDVQFYSGKPDYGAEWPTRYVDVQWRSLRFDGGKYFSAISDGVKLRDITNDQSVPSFSLSWRGNRIVRQAPAGCVRSLPPGSPACKYPTRPTPTGGVRASLNVSTRPRVRENAWA